MRQLTITTIMLLTVTIFMSGTLFSQERSNVVPVRGGSPLPLPITHVTDTIDVPFTGGSGWHVIHKEAPKRFLKEVPRRTTDACVKCHIKDEYKIFDPHKQRNEKGEIIGEKCLYCHVENPIDLGIPSTKGSGWHVIHKEAPERFLKEVPLQSVCFKCHVKDEKTATFKEIKIIENSTMLCQGCHGRGYIPAHPADASHILKPSPKILAMMKEGEKKFDIVFSLDHDGKVTCVTCHNPHEKGIIPVGMRGAEGAGEKYGSRLPRQTCTGCHKDK